MPSRRKHQKISQGFFLILADEDRKIFNIAGPITDDTAWNHKIVELQNSGRKVRCFSTSIDPSVEQIAAQYSNQTGFAFSKNLITDPPGGIAAGYQGPLPGRIRGRTAYLAKKTS
jgi:hypothetical protein